MKKFILSLTGILALMSLSAQRITENDGDWSLQFLVLKNTAEADLMIRVGDIDNLGFGFEEDYNPFGGASTGSHPYPWDPKPENARGTDRIMVPSSYNYRSYGNDGYTETTKRPGNNPQRVSIPLAALRGQQVDSAALQLFIDDFQAPSMGSRFQVRINGLRFTEAEKMINRIDQTGPIGKLITIRFTPEMMQKLSGDSLVIAIDDPVNKIGDGYALDFVKLLINPRFIYKGKVSGRIIDQETREPLPGAHAVVEGMGMAVADADGNFFFEELPAGLNILTGTHPGYAADLEQVDVVYGETRVGIELELKRSAKLSFNNKTVQEGDDIILNNIQFDISSALLKPAGKQELDKVAAFLKLNTTVEIELSGHTSAEGGAALNRELSLKRVRSCKDYLVSKGIDDGRISIRGYGPDLPIAPNDTEPGRAKNRRVEMKLTRL